MCIVCMKIKQRSLARLSAKPEQYLSNTKLQTSLTRVWIKFLNLQWFALQNATATSSLWWSNAKAFNSEDSELLSHQLDFIDFDGRIKSLVYVHSLCTIIILFKSRPKEACIPPVWFTIGVKQGCVLSPLLFAL